MLLEIVGALFAVAAGTGVEVRQSPIGSIRIEPPGGGPNPIVISVTGIEHDPIEIAARWNADDGCLSDVACFVASWIEANANNNLERLLHLRAPTERAEFQRRLTPDVLTRNSARFRAIRKWHLIGWVEYGHFRFVLLVREDEQGSAIYTLPLRRVDSRFAQTDTLGTDTGVYAIVDRIGMALMEKRQKRGRQ